MPIPFARLPRRLFAAAFCVLALARSPAQISAATLGTAPRAPTEQALEQLRAVRGTQPQPLATPVSLSVDPASREAVRQFYLGVYSAADNVPAQWTGSIASGNAGDTSATFKAAVLLRINAVRAFAGVPAAITLNSTYSSKAQQAALMMSANGALSHSPPTSWTYYTAAGAEAASNSNLSIGDYGPSAITGYIADPGDGNAAAGHRRWLLYPQTREMGTGDVPASGSYQSTNATWVIDSYFGTPRPATRDTYVAWPAPGYFPAPLIFPRWSFSYPGATFTNATVAMTRGGTPVAVKLEPVQSGLGENTLVWVYDNLDAGSSAALSVTSDTTFHVEITNVVVNGAARSFSYDVTAIDPTQPGSDTTLVTVTGTPSPAVGFANAYTIAQPSFADTVQWRTLQFDTTLTTYDAESGLGGLTASTTGAYGGRSTATVGAGTASYELATATFDDQFLTLPETYYAAAGSNPTMSFLSRLGTATTGQVAHVQVSTDEGSSWRDVYTQRGTGGNGETSFIQRSIALADLAGLTFRIRFAYTWTPGLTAYLQTTDGVGWYFDNIRFTGLQRVASATAATSSGPSFTFNPAAAGSYGLQARGLLFGTYPLSWGPVAAATAAAVSTAPTFSVQPASRAIDAGASASLSASVTGASLQWQLNGRDLAGATGATLALSSFQPAAAGLYTLVAANALGTTPSAAAIVGVSTAEKFVGAGQVVGSNIQHPNGNIFDQVLLTGSAEAITADYAEKQVTRTSFVDLDNDIVQVEFSGPGTLTLVLDGASGPALPVNYNQGVSYMKGHAGIVITGATEQTNVSVFSVGRANAVNQALFKDGVTYDGIADIAFIAIQSANGQFGGVRTANANYFADHGTTGLYAPGVTFNGPIYLGNITAFDSATPVILLGAASVDNRITGGDLFQDNGKPVQVSGLTQLKFMEGSDSHSHPLSAKTNRAVLQQNGVDVTAQIVVNPAQ